MKRNESGNQMNLRRGSSKSAHEPPSAPSPAAPNAPAIQGVDVHPAKGGRTYNTFSRAALHISRWPSSAVSRSSWCKLQTSGDLVCRMPGYCLKRGDDSYENLAVSNRLFTLVVITRREPSVCMLAGSSRSLGCTVQVFESSFAFEFGNGSWHRLPG